MVDKGLRRTRSILADDQRGRSMSVDVIGAILRVVFDHKDGGVIPVDAVGNGIDDATHREIIVGDRRQRSWLAGARASGVVVRQVKQRELWKFFAGSLSFHKLIEFAQELVSAELCVLVGLKIWDE